MGLLRAGNRARGRGDILQRHVDHTVQFAPLPGERNRPMIAGKQLCSEMGLKARDLLADSGLSDAQLLSGA